METNATGLMAEDRPRALVTDRECEILLGEDPDVSEKYYGVVVTRVRNRIKRLRDKELEAIAEHDTLVDELEQVVCGDSE